MQEKRESAFQALMDQYRARVINICYGYTRQKQDAEDVAQEVFLEVFRSIQRFDGKVALWVWLYRLATNKSIDFIRAKTRKKRFAHLKSLFKEDGNELEIPDTGSTIEDLENEELRKVLTLVIDRLPRRQKTAFVLSRNDELPNAQIAEVMHISEGAVESLITRANRHLRKLLQTYYNHRL